MPNTQQPPTHDCENNIESNMTAPHCRVCAPTHNEVEETTARVPKTSRELAEFLIPETDLNLILHRHKRKEIIDSAEILIDSLLLAQKKQIEERVEKAEKEILDYQNNFRAGGATPEATEFGYNIAMDRCLGILAAVKEALSE